MNTGGHKHKIWGSGTCVPCIQLGRKPILLIGSGLMFLSHTLSATLIVGYDLEDGGGLDGFSTSQTVAGYFVFFSVCLFIASASVSVG